MSEHSERPPTRPRSRALGFGLLVAAALAWVGGKGAFVQPPPASGGDRRRFLAGAAAGLLAPAGTFSASAGTLAVKGNKTTKALDDRPAQMGGGGPADNPRLALPEVDPAFFQRDMIDVGRVTQLRGKCFEVPSDDKGKTATVGVFNVVVWDEDADCGEGLSKIFAVGRDTLQPMIAKGGQPIHTFRSASWEDATYIKELKQQVGKCYKTPTGGENVVKWKIADLQRGGKC